MQPSGQRRNAEICQRKSGQAVARKNGGFVQVEASAGAAQNDHHGMRSAAGRNEQSPDGCLASAGGFVYAATFVWDFQIARRGARREKISREGGASEHLAVE